MFAFMSRLLGWNRQSKRAPARRPARPRLQCEALEDRQMLSVFGEFQVSAPTVYQFGGRYESANASSAYNRSVVVWRTDYGTTDSDIRAQLYDGVGNRVGGEFGIATSTKKEHAPAVAMDSQGNFVVAWTLDYSST